MICLKQCNSNSSRGGPCRHPPCNPKRDKAVKMTWGGKIVTINTVTLFFTQSNKLNSSKVTFQSHPLLLYQSVLQTTVNVLELRSWSPDKPNHTPLQPCENGCSPTVIQPDGGSAEEYVRICPNPGVQSS